eukprot:jgi/Chrzof1/9743/Cz04g14070.t1
MDGNSRWARLHGLDITAGHNRGIQALQAAIHCCQQNGIPALTVYAFSQENWSRASVEVNFLMALFQRSIQQHIADLGQQGVRLKFIGQLGRLPGSLQQTITRAESETAGNTALLLTVAISYSSRQDITQAAKYVATMVAEGKLRPDQVTEDLLEAHLSTAHLVSEVGAPDLLIRTSGEQRLSNYLLWEMAYTELYFTNVLWPDFKPEHFYAALKEYAARDRRYGRR